MPPGGPWRGRDLLSLGVPEPVNGLIFLRLHMVFWSKVCRCHILKGVP